jgi:hypothetical protein
MVEGSSFPQVNLLYCIDATEWVANVVSTGDRAGSSGDRRLWRYAVSWNDDWFGQRVEGWRVVERQALEEPC